MPDFPSLGLAANAVIEWSGASPVASGSVNVKGAYSQLIASTARDYHALLVSVRGSGNPTNRRFLIDIAIGAAASEVVVISNIPVNTSTTNGFRSTTFLIPVHIKAGSRIAARCQSTSASAGCDVDIQGMSSSVSDSLDGLCTTYGANTGTTAGTTVTSGAANTKGSYTELIASTTAPIHWLVIFIDTSGTTSFNEYLLIDIAIGAAGSEQNVLTNLRSSMMVGDALSPSAFYIPVSIPTGSRISIRTQFAGASRTALAMLIGVS